MQALLHMQFVGTRYHGFQVQANALSVCEVLQNALEQLYGERPQVKGCSRTDAGVHALDYCVSFHQPKPIDVRRLPLAINRFLPHDIRVLSAKNVPDAFHARYDAVKKAYLYKLHNSAVDNVFEPGLSWRCAQQLDVAAMNAAAQRLCGTHDYAAFMSAGSKMEDTVRTVHSFTVRKQGSSIVFRICADGYLYNMVRILVGTLVEVGAHRMAVETVSDVLQSKNRALAGDTAPACGLYLAKVYY